MAFKTGTQQAHWQILGLNLNPDPTSMGQEAGTFFQKFDLVANMQLATINSATFLYMLIP